MVVGFTAISKNLGKKNKLITGYVYGTTEKSNYLHSCVEVDIKGTMYVIDGIVNGVVNKEGYYLMQNAEVINIINNDEMLMMDNMIPSNYNYEYEKSNELKKNF